MLAATNPTERSNDCFPRKYKEKAVNILKNHKKGPMIVSLENPINDKIVANIPKSGS